MTDAVTESSVKLPNNFKFIESTESVDYEKVAIILNSFGLSDADASTQEKTFKASHGVEFIYHKDELVACGRVLSDGISQSAVYNIAVDEHYHGQKLGTLLMTRIVERYRHTNIILYTHPKTVSWYKKLGFSNLNTGMIIFGHEDNNVWFKKVGFIK